MKNPKILAINGSMRGDRMTSRLLHAALGRLTDQCPGAQLDFVQIRDLDVSPCRVTCYQYCSTHPYQCSQKDDVASVLDKMIEADAILLAAPHYFRGPPAKFQCLAERLVSIFYFLESNSSADSSSPESNSLKPISARTPLNDKICGLIGTAEYSNPHSILEYLQDFCHVLKMHTVSLKQFPYLGVCGQGDVDADQVFRPYARIDDLVAEILAQLGANP